MKSYKRLKKNLF